MKSAKLSITLSIFLVLALISVLSSQAWAYSSIGDNSAPVCNNAAPKTVWPFSAKASGNNAIELNWGQIDSASSWTVAYGVKSGTYIYGINNFGNNGSRSVTISNLPAGIYYVVMRANNGCRPGPFSNEWKVSVGGGGAVTASLPNIVTTPQTPPPSQGRQQNITPKPTSSARQIIPTITENKKSASPTPKAPRGTASSTGIFQSIINFFLGLFK